MLDQRIKRIKLYFFALSGLALLALFAGIVGLKDNPYLTGRYFDGWVTNWRYRIEYATNGKIFASEALSTLFGTTETYVSSEVSTPGVPVLVYHGITDESGDEYTLSKENFKNHMFALRRAGYKTVGLEDLLMYLRGEKNLPPKSIVITFDDGRKDAYYNADPILKAVGFKATMFAITRYSLDKNGSSYYLSSEELEQMHKSGRWDIQAHTDDGHGDVPIDGTGSTGHFFSNKMWLVDQDRLETDEEYAARIESDMRSVKSKLETELGKPIIGFAFPFGDHGQVTSNYPKANEVMLEKASAYFPLHFYQHGPGDRQSITSFDALKTGDASFLVRRIDIRPEWDDQRLLSKIEAASPKELPYSDDFTKNRGWVPAWGVATISPGRLALTGETVDTGAAAVLDGTGGWKDYEVTATVSNPGRNGVYVWVRFQNEYNTAACNFGNGFAHIEQTVGGQQRVIKGYRDPSVVIPSGDFEVTVRVKGRHVECMMGGAMVATDFLDVKLAQGGIGFKTWDKESEVKLVVKRLDVKDISKGVLPSAEVTDKSFDSGSVPVAHTR